MSETLEERVANILSANTLIWVQGNTECRWLTDEERDALLSLACRPDPTAELSRLRAEFEIVRKASRLFEDAANNWQSRALAAEQAPALAREAPSTGMIEAASREWLWYYAVELEKRYHGGELLDDPAQPATAEALWEQTPIEDRKMVADHIRVALVAALRSLSSPQPSEPQPFRSRFIGPQEGEPDYLQPSEPKGTA